MDKIENKDPLSRFPRLERIEPGSDGWLSPSGFFFKAGKDEHKELADWIVENNLTGLRKGKRGAKKDLEYMEESGATSTQFLRDKGWILINGPVFRTQDALNYTTKQLRLLSEAGIPVVGAYDGSKEFSSQETIEWVESAADNVSTFIESQKNKTLIWTSDGWQPREVDQVEFWKSIENRGYSTLEDFRNDPFHTTFGDFGLVKFGDVRDVLTKDYTDEIVFDHGQETYTLRLIELPSGERICVEYTFHHHIGHGSGNEEQMNVYVVDNFKFREKIEKLLGTGIVPKIKGDYFDWLYTS